jgi:hypothetical protein
MATSRWAGEQPVRQSRGPSSLRTHTWLGALRSGRVMLSRPSPLPMAPADFRSALHRFAGSLLIGFAATGHRGAATRGHITPVPRRISPVPWPAIQPFRSPYPGGSIGAALPSSSRRRSPSPIFAGLGSRTCPATQASLSGRQDSSSYGPVGCLPPRDFVVALRRSGLPFRRPPATGLLGHYPDRTFTGKSTTASPGHTEDRLEHDPRRRHHHPVGDTRDAERPQSA